MIDHSARKPAGDDSRRFSSVREPEPCALSYAACPRHTRKFATRPPIPPHDMTPTEGGMLPREDGRKSCFWKSLAPDAVKQVPYPQKPSSQCCLMDPSQSLPPDIQSGFRVSQAVIGIHGPDREISVSRHGFCPTTAPCMPAASWT